MINLLLFRIFSFYVALLLIVFPTSLSAGEVDSSIENSIPFKNDKASGEMTPKQMNDLFGEDPYLGQTSYLQSPDGFNQRDKSN